ncbi:hypothetical protein K2X33_06030 [bacterium]|nr:hypothetical protein [bacterium]
MLKIFALLVGLCFASVSDKEIEALIEKLGAGDYELRLEAHQALFALGERAVPVLEKYRDDADTERRWRVRQLAKKPVNTITPEELILSVPRWLEKSNEEAQLEDLQREIQVAYDDSQEKLHPIAGKAAWAITTQRHFGAEESPDAVIASYVDVLASALPEGLVQRKADGALYLKRGDRTYRLTCFDRSLGHEVFQLSATNSPNAKIALNQILPIARKLSNGRAVENKWSNGKPINPDEPISLRPHISFNPRDGLRFGDYVRYQVNEGVTATGDHIQVGYNVAQVFFTWEQSSRAENNVRALFGWH